MDTVNNHMNFPQNSFTKDNNSSSNSNNNNSNSTGNDIGPSSGTDNSKLQNKKHYHTQEESDDIVDYLHLNNSLQSNLCKHLDTINRQNQIIFKKIMQLFENIYTAFDILFTNSVLASKIINENDHEKTYYIIYDEKLKDNFNIIKNFTNNYNINLLTRIINNLFNTNKVLYFANTEIYVKSIQNNTLYSKEENIQIINKFIDIVRSFDITDTSLSLFGSIYMECIKMYQFSHKIITEAFNNQSHYIAKHIQSLILEELQKARLLIPDIKNEIDSFTKLIPAIKPFITSYVDNCSKMMHTYL